MTKRLCSYAECGDRRVHWCSPDEPRGAQYVDAPADWPEGHPVYCSMTCGLLDGWLTLAYETVEETEARQVKWLAGKPRIAKV